MVDSARVRPRVVKKNNDFLLAILKFQTYVLLIHLGLCEVQESHSRECRNKESISNGNYRSDKHPGSRQNCPITPLCL